jgi:hypothetical protein
MTSTTCEDPPDLSRQAREYHGGSWTMNEHTVWFCTAVSLVLLVLLVSLVSLVSLVFMAHLMLPMISGSADPLPVADCPRYGGHEDHLRHSLKSGLLLATGSLLALVLVEELLAHPDRIRSDLHQFVILDVLEG